MNNRENKAYVTVGCLSFLLMVVLGSLISCGLAYGFLWIIQQFA